jgi:hypothetical protein
MTAQSTAGRARLTERQKAWARLALLTVVGLVCPPVAAARSGVVWVLYLLLAVLYSLWTVHAARRASRDRLAGYLLCLTDGVVLLPILVWSPGVAMRVVLALLWAVGLAATLRADQGRRASRVSRSSTRRSAGHQRAGSRKPRPSENGLEAPLERALRVRLRVLADEGARFALVVLRAAGHKESVARHGEEAAKRLMGTVGRDCLRLLGADAQSFLLPGGRVAFVFATDTPGDSARARKRPAEKQIDPYDVESLAMALGRRACGPSPRAHRLEFVVGWASAPADGTTADDLMYAAESGALSTAAFRRVGGARVAVQGPEKKRAAAG